MSDKERRRDSPLVRCDGLASHRECCAVQALARGFARDGQPLALGQPRAGEHQPRSSRARAAVQAILVSWTTGHADLDGVELPQSEPRGRGCAAAARRWLAAAAARPEHDAVVGGKSARAGWQTAGGLQAQPSLHSGAQSTPPGIGSGLGVMDMVRIGRARGATGLCMIDPVPPDGGGVHSCCALSLSQVRSATLGPLSGHGRSAGQCMAGATAALGSAAAASASRGSIAGAQHGEPWLISGLSGSL